MSKEQKIITKEDLLPLDAYTKVRRQMRKELVEFKKNRRILLGPYATFYFECYETMIAQVQEMLYIDHKEYSHTTKFSEDNIKALSADFN